MSVAEDDQKELNGTRLMVQAGNFFAVFFCSFFCSFSLFFAVFRFSLGNSRVWGAQFFAVFCSFSLFFAVFRFFVREPMSTYH